MTDSDWGPFVEEFTRLSRALETRRESPQDINQRADAYFHVLKRIPFAMVKAKATQWLNTQTKFPKPVEWQNIPVPSASSEIPQLSNGEAAIWLDAEKRGFEGDRCTCVMCRQAHVGELQVLRFVPEFDAEDRERKARIGERIVTTGHWARGLELKRWYQAKAAFSEAMAERFGTGTAKRLSRMLRKVGVEDREIRKPSDFEPVIG